MSADPYDIFIRGETIDLALPNDHAIDYDGWHDWLNDAGVNRYTGHGQIPNTRAKQRQFLAGLLAPDSNRFALLILPKGEQRAVGTVSLSSINREHGRAETAMIIGDKPRGPGAMFYGLEAKARIVEHAFVKMGLRRIVGYQVVDLADWQNYQFLFGFRPEGVLRGHQRVGQTFADVVVTACLYDDYQRIVSARGAFWPGKSALLELMRDVPRKRSLVGDVGDAIQGAVAAFDGDIGGDE